MYVYTRWLKKVNTVAELLNGDLETRKCAAVKGGRDGAVYEYENT